MNICLRILRLTDCLLPKQWIVKTNREYIAHMNASTDRLL